MDAESICIRAEACEIIANKYGQGHQPFDDIVEELRGTDAMNDEVDSYVDQAVKQLSHGQA
jgi:hypothetical protein